VSVHLRRLNLDCSSAAWANEPSQDSEYHAPLSELHCVGAAFLASGASRASRGRSEWSALLGGRQDAEVSI